MALPAETQSPHYNDAMRDRRGFSLLEVVVALLKTVFPRYRVILVEVVNEAIRKIIADRRKAQNENESAGEGEKA